MDGSSVFSLQSSVFRGVEKTDSIKMFPKTQRVTRWRSWLRHCATIRKVAGSIDLIISAALWRWDRLSLQQKQYQGYFLGVRRPVRWTENLATFIVK